MSRITLRIKKVYLRAIASGEKRIEYRKDSAFYRKMFATRPTILTLHYQSAERLSVEIKRIRRVRKPRRFFGLDMFPSSRIFEIHLGRILSYQKQ